ncbi:hypothetical protein [Clostridium sp. HMP27]|uniref:hypothetical protein n=1 Tax=Clostridium sp. HMP27 TaxID=1487921 RepID=UPI00052CA03D|nr:hypothetical protein [Clostridium sp. HMP27]KGK88018.1 hypothetical protein DP68_08785 [Clostridium sp. HMP27]
MAKQWIDFRLKDMYAVKHSLQNVVRQKEQELNYIKDHDKTSAAEIKISQLEEDIEHEKWLVQKMVNEIEDFKIGNKIK